MRARERTSDATTHERNRTPGGAPETASRARRRPIRSVAAALVVGLAGAAAAAQETPAVAPERGPVPATMTQEETRPALDRACAWLCESQNEDGSWGNHGIESNWSSFAALETYYAWKMASTSLAVHALLDVPETPTRRAALERGLEWLCTTRVPKRPYDWDVDHVWTGLCGLVALERAARDERFQGEPWKSRVDARGREILALLVANQVPGGGWAYYDDPPYTSRPKWATSFCTAMVLPALRSALERGWGEDEAVLERARVALRRCALPNGAFTYSVDGASSFRGGESIDSIKGSLGRTQVGNWALARLGDERYGPERLREGLDAFFEHHRFLDVARMRPIPHEAYYANAAYFYLFAHHYAAEAIELLPEDEREAWHARLRPHLVKVQRTSGASVDFLGTEKFTVAGTAFTARALALGLDPKP